MEGRKVTDVAKQILDVIPETEIYPREQIEKFIQGQFYQAPETLYSAYNWTKFINLLNNILIPESATEQIKQILNQSPSK